jgi:hypothetical protein
MRRAQKKFVLQAEEGNKESAEGGRQLLVLRHVRPYPYCLLRECVLQRARVVGSVQKWYLGRRLRPSWRICVGEPREEGARGGGMEAYYSSAATWDRRELCAACAGASQSAPQTERAAGEASCA